jgi:APA family basic amino acid/polyamine antiporter
LDHQDDASSHNSHAPGLVRQLGLVDCISIIMGIMIGSGIFLMAGSIARQLDSLVAVVCVWALGGLLSLAGALSLSELGSRIPFDWGLYVYLTEAYGAPTGFLYGWSAILIYVGSIVTLAAAVGFYIAPYFNLTPHGEKLAQISSIVLFTCINCLGVWPAPVFRIQIILI